MYRQGLKPNVYAVDGQNPKALKLEKRMKQLEYKTPKSLQVNFKWEEKEQIGKGSFGTVVLGTNSETGEVMAVKKIALGVKTSTLEETEREIKLLSELDDSEFVVKLIGFQIVEDLMYIFMEYVEGGSIEKQIQRYGKVTEKLARKYTYQVVKGLSHLHDQGVLHGDLKCKFSN